MENFLGTDIKLDEDGDFVIGPDGDLTLCEGTDCVIQDISHRIMTVAGSMFYDPEYGAGVPRFIHTERTRTEAQRLVQAIESELVKEPRIAPDSIEARIQTWQKDEVAVLISFLIAGESIPTNLVLGWAPEGFTLSRA